MGVHNNNMRKILLNKAIRRYCLTSRTVKYFNYSNDGITGSFLKFTLNFTELFMECKRKTFCIRES